MPTFENPRADAEAILAFHQEFPEHSAAANRIPDHRINL
ncbi:hypothetical protein BH09ACT10_BH09ACT10_00700 [soil metagenome]